MCSKSAALFSRCLLTLGIATAVNSLTTPGHASIVVTSVYRSIGDTIAGTILNTPALSEPLPVTIYSVSAKADTNSTTTAPANTSTAFGTYNHSISATSTLGGDTITSTASQNTVVSASPVSSLALTLGGTVTANGGPSAQLDANGRTAYQIYFVVDTAATYTFSFLLSVTKSGSETGHFNSVFDYLLLEDMTTPSIPLELSFHKKTTVGNLSGTDQESLTTATTYRLTALVNYSWSGPGTGSGGNDIAVLAVPEPAAAVLAVSGLMTFAMIRLARRRSA